MNSDRGLVRQWLRMLLSMTLSLVVALGAAAQELQPVPPLKGRVTDLTGTLTADQVSSLDKSLSSYEERKGIQLAILMVQTTRPEAIEQYAMRVVEQWKLGRRKIDDGALLLVAKNDREVRLEVGYGLEGALDDVKARRVIAEIITPYFRQGDFYGGVTAGMEQIQRILDGEALPTPSRRADSEGDIRQAWPAVLVVTLVLGGILRRVLGRLPGALVAGGVLSALAWLVVGTLTAVLVAGLAGFFVTLLGIGLGGHHGRGGWPGGGGMGGGGFRGGGGGFGGGGASGRW